MAEENCAQHLKITTEQTRECFVAKTGEVLFAGLSMLGGGVVGNMKASLIKRLPHPLSKIATSTTTSQSGKAGLWELARALLAEEHKRERESLRHKPKKYVKMSSAQHR